MPTSPYDDTVVILDFLGALLAQKTCSILDVGSGFGRWGFLCRCHLGYGRSLTVESRQALTIDAIERFEPNITPIYDCVYNNVHAGDAVEILPTLGSYDIVICSHALEHLERGDGERLLEGMAQHARQAIILSVPLGDWPQDAEYGNPWEVHKSVWHAEDFRGPSVFLRRYGGGSKAYLLVIRALSAEAKWLAKMMNSPVRYWLFKKAMALRALSRPKQRDGE